MNKKVTEKNRKERRKAWSRKRQGDWLKNVLEQASM
jgi:hypothetical protein